MGKTSPLTGTGKKAQKKLYKAQGELAEMSVKQRKHDERYRKSSQHDLRQIAKGQGAAKYDKLSLHDLQRDFERAGKGAAKIFEPMRQEALANFDQYVQPENVNAYGRESGGNSSALNQAMAAAKGNLQRQLTSDFAGIQSNLANQFIGQREQSRQFSTQNQMQNLNARMQANAGVMGQPISPVFGGLQASYNQKQPSQQQDWGSSIGNLATGAAALWTASSREIKDHIKDYEKGLEIARELEVKNYDYTIPVNGKQQNRVGLIAEDVPEEFRGMIGDINAVDVYGLVGLLINCVKQLDEKVKQLEAKV